MKGSIPFYIALIGCVVAATSASAQAAGQSAETRSAALMELQAQSAAVDGDWSAVADLAGRAYQQSPSINNEFNLATAYTHVGQTALAIPLYADVAAKGQFVEAPVLYDYRSRPRPVRVRYNVADEANRRLELLSGQPIQDGRTATAKTSLSR